MTASTELWQPTPNSTFREVRRWVATISEDGVIDSVTRILPWLSPLPTALLIRSSVESYLGMDAGLSWIVAMTVELIGITSIHTALSFHAWNAAHEDKAKKAPLAFAITLAIAYVVVSVALIAILEILSADNRRYAHGVIPLLPVMSVLVFALRSSHNKRIRLERGDIEIERSRTWSVEDSEREHKNKLSVLRLTARLGLPVEQAIKQLSPVSTTVNDTKLTVVDEIDRVQAANQARLEKKLARQKRVAELIEQGKTVAEIVALGVGSLNTIKDDVKTLKQQPAMAGD